MFAEVLGEWDDRRYHEADLSCRRRMRDQRFQERRASRARRAADSRHVPVEIRLNDKYEVVGSYHYVVYSSRSWIVADVKNEIEINYEIPRLCQNYTHEGVEYEDHMPLSDLPPGDVLTLSLSLCMGRLCDYRYCLKSVQRTWKSLENAPLPFRDDDAMVLSAVYGRWSAYRYASTRIRSDPVLARSVLKQEVPKSAMALEWVGEELKADRRLVLVAVRRNWRALKYAAPELRADRGVVLCAMRQDVHALQFATGDLLSNSRRFLPLFKANPGALEYASMAMRQNRTLILAAVQADAKLLQFASQALRGDRAVALAALRQDASKAIDHIAPELKHDPFVIAACQGSPEAVMKLDAQAREGAEYGFF